MDLEKAYNKIDNFCCLNSSLLQGNKVKYPNGEEEVINMFKHYQETKDDDFCKDVDEMVDALETIKKLVDLQKELNCPLDVFLDLFIHNRPFYYEDENKKMHLIERYEFYNKDIIIFGRYNGCSVYLKDYKKTWFLKENKEE